MASHLLAIRQRNFSRAESDLYKAFEALIADKSPRRTLLLPADTRPAEIWTRMTIAAIEMHHKFGH